MQAHTVKTAVKRLTDTLEKHKDHFQCQQTEFRCKKVIRISISHSFVHTMTVKTVILYDNLRINIFNNHNGFTFVSLYNFTQN